MQDQLGHLESPFILHSTLGIDSKEGGQLGPCLSWDESMEMAV